jgi:hypothetical protein
MSILNRQNIIENVQFIVLFFIILCYLIFRKPIAQRVKKIDFINKFPRRGQEHAFTIFLFGVFSEFVGLIFNWYVWEFYSNTMMIIGILGTWPFAMRMKQSFWPPKPSVLTQFEVLSILILPILFYFSGLVIGVYLFNQIPRWYFLLLSSSIVIIGFIGMKRAEYYYNRI